jgi:hypothetical protein
MTVLLAVVAKITLHRQNAPVDNSYHQPEIVEDLQIVEWRRCATSQKVASSIPDGVIWIFH